MSNTSPEPQGLAAKLINCVNQFALGQLFSGFDKADKEITQNAGSEFCCYPNDKKDAEDIPIDFYYGLFADQLWKVSSSDSIEITTYWPVASSDRKSCDGCCISVGIDSALEIKINVVA